MSMSGKDRRAIEQIFARLEEVARHSPPRDPEADRFIEQQMARRPGSAYYMAQSIVALEEALKTANQQLEDATGRRASEGSLMPRRPAAYDDEAVRSGRGFSPDVSSSGAYGPSAAEAPATGFLAGAFQTALGVAGGTLLGNSIASIFGSGKARAAESRRDEPQQSGHDRDAADGADDHGNDYDDDQGGGFLDSIFGSGDED
jgi:uncharacterized protein